MIRGVTIIWALLLATHAPAGAYGAQGDGNSSDWQATVTSESAPLYAGVSTPNKVIATLSRGDAVTVNLEITTGAGKWYSVTVGREKPVAGYMDGKDLGVEEPDNVALWEFKPPPEPVDPSNANPAEDAAAAAAKAKIESDIKGFFVSKFGRTLPVSAFGQSGLHDRWGFDHRNAVDVALSPDSFEGQKLVKQLRTFGVPFLTFRHAIPGVATGAHIHVGRPSHRKSRRR